MKITNILLIILIGLVAFQKFPEQPKKTVSSEPKITIKPRETHSINAISKNENPIKHSTTFRNYIDTDGRNSQGINHNIRVGKEYYISAGVNTRENSYGQRDVSGDVSITKYW